MTTISRVPARYRNSLGQFAAAFPGELSRQERRLLEHNRPEYRRMMTEAVRIVLQHTGLDDASLAIGLGVRPERIADLRAGGTSLSMLACAKIRILLFRGTRPIDQGTAHCLNRIVGFLTWPVFRSEPDEQERSDWTQCLREEIARYRVLVAGDATRST